MKEERAGGDDAIRPAFPSTPQGLAPYGWPIFRLHQSLIALRRRHPGLHRARTRQLHLTNTQLVLAMTVEHGTLFLALNLADEPASLPVPEARCVEVGDGDLDASGDGSARVRLGAHGFAILSA